MRAAIIKNGVVSNIIIVNPDACPGFATLTGDLPVAVGDTYDGTDFWRDGKKVLSPADEAAEYIEALRILGVEV